MRLLIWLRYAGLFALAGMLGIAAAATNPVLRLQFKPSSSVSGWLTLADIAHASSPNLQLLQRAMALPVHHLGANFGVTVSFDAQRISEELRQSLSLKGSELIWVGSSATDLPKSTLIPGQQLADLAQTALDAWIQRVVPQLGHTEVFVEQYVALIPPDLKTPTRPWRIEVRDLSDSSLSNRMTVWVDLYSDLGLLRSVPIRIDVSLWKPLRRNDGAVLRAALPIPTSTINASKTLVAAPIPPEGVLTQVRTITTQRPTLKTSNDPSHSLPEDPAIAVHPGQRLILKLSEGSLVLEREVEVLHSAQIGQLVKVRPVQGHGDLMAKVVGPKLLGMYP